MKRINLHIFAYDIFHTEYNNGNDCAITRALDRGGYTQFRHEGTDISHTETRDIIVDRRNKSFVELTNIVYEMYQAKEEKNFVAVQDFHFSIKY